MQLATRHRNPSSSLLKKSTRRAIAGMRCQNNAASRSFASREQLGRELGEVEKRHAGVFQQTASVLSVWIWFLSAAPLAFVSAEEIPLQPFQTSAEPVFQQLSPEFCWFHPRVAPLPGFGKRGQPAVMMTIQKHLAADDHYSGMYTMRTDDMGKTWTGPTEIPELAWRQGENNETISVCDATPLWHKKSGQLVVIGVKLRYSAAGEQLLDQPQSQECAYAVYDPRANVWSRWKTMSLPDPETKFYIVTPGCVQFLERPDGSLLVPLYFNRRGGEYTTTVVHASFDGQEMKYLEHGDELTKRGGRGFVEPSLVQFGDQFYLTLRNNDAAYVTTSEDGLRFQPPRKWTWDDGLDLGSYNTQAHWLANAHGLFLVYTRRGANNDHITRNRAPLFMAQVDPARLQVLRQTEQAVLPERGVMLGNFGATNITENEAWITDAEFIVADKPHSKGANGTVWLGRVKWLAAPTTRSKPEPR